MTSLLADPWLARQVRFEYLNTTPGEEKRPGAVDLSNLRRALAHGWAIFRKARHVDVVHLNLAPAPLLPLLRALFLAVAARAGGSRVVLHAHTGRLHHYTGRRSYRFVLGITLRVVDAFIVVSGAAEEAVRDVGPNVVRLANGLDPWGFQTGPKTENPPTLLFVGTVCERKGLLDLRDALGQVMERNGNPRPLAAQIVGDGTQEGPGVFDRVRAAYERAGLDWVDFTGALRQDQVKEILSRASIFCLPSHWEGFPISMLEAMASQTAIIATRVGDIPEMLGQGTAGILVDPRDPSALADAIERLLSHREERETLGRNARVRVEEEYDQSRLVQSLLAIYAGGAGR